MTLIRGNDVATLRWINSRAVLAQLHFDDGPTRSVTELAQRVQLSRPTVEAALSDLAAEGWVQEVSATASPHKAGRPARRYQFAARAGVLVGVDLGPHNIVTIVADLRGEVLSVERRSGLDLQSGNDAWKIVHELVSSALQASGMRPSDVRAITAGVPAIVNSDGDIALTTVVPDWVESGLPDRLHEAFPTARVLYDNDAKLATLAEAEWGNAGTVDDAVFLLVGQRLSAGIIIDGKVHRGRNGSAGEIGANASVGWERAVDRLRERIAGTSLDAELDAASAGEPDAVTALRSFVDEIAPGLATLILAVDPQLVVVGGGFARAGQPFVAALRTAVTPYCLFVPDFQLTSLDSDAVARGAVARSLAHLRTVDMHLPGV